MRHKTLSTTSLTLLLLIALGGTPTKSTANAQEPSVCDRPGVCCITREGVRELGPDDVSGTTAAAESSADTTGPVQPASASDQFESAGRKPVARHRRRSSSRATAAAAPEAQPQPLNSQKTASAPSTATGRDEHIVARTDRALLPSNRSRIVWLKRTTHPFDRTQPPRNPPYVTAVFV